MALYGPEHADTLEIEGRLGRAFLMDARGRHRTASRVCRDRPGARPDRDPAHGLARARRHSWNRNAGSHRRNTPFLPVDVLSPRKRSRPEAHVHHGVGVSAMSLAALS